MSEVINDQLDFQLVWKDKSRQQLSVDFWERLLPHVSFDKWERASQVVLQVIYNSNVIGLSTAFEIQVPEFNNNLFYSFRMLIDPKLRIPGLADQILVKTIDFLEGLNIENESKCIGVMTLIENPEIIKKRREVIYKSSKLLLAGYTKNGRQIRLRYFKGAKI